MSIDDYVDIERIIKADKQGKSGVFFCKASDGHHYWVKGHNVGRPDQVKEWLCGHLAKAFGLPVAPFCLANIDEDLIRHSPTELQKPGFGPVFASRHAGEGAIWFGVESQQELLPTSLRQDILLFDYWIQNSDRCPINPNLLWDAVTGTIVVIDHNWAFDQDVDAPSLLKNHIFSNVDRTQFNDLDCRSQWLARMDIALEHMESQIAAIPDEWRWADLEQTRSADIDLPALLAALSRFRDNETFWSVL